MLNCLLTKLDGSLFEGEAEEIRIPGIEGDFGILPGHEKFISLIDIGEVKIKINSDDTRTYLVKNGICQILLDRIIIAVDHGILVDDIDKDLAKQSVRDDEERIEKLEKNPDNNDGELVSHIKSRIEWYNKLIEY